MRHLQRMWSHPGQNRGFSDTTSHGCRALFHVWHGWTDWKTSRHKLSSLSIVIMSGLCVRVYVLERSEVSCNRGSAYARYCSISKYTDTKHTQTAQGQPRWPSILNVQIWTSYVKAFQSYRLKDRQTDRQTWPKLYTTPLRGWSTRKASDCDALQHEAARCCATRLRFHYEVYTIKFEVNQPIRFCLITFYCWYPTFRCDLDLAPFDLERLYW